jgi:hypothetical protein
MDCVELTDFGGELSGDEFDDESGPCAGGGSGGRSGPPSGAEPGPGGVYTGRGPGTYVGQTGNFLRRTMEWLRKDLIIRRIAGTESLTTLQRRAVEQRLIERLRAQGVPLLNKINSISPKSPVYNEMMKWADDFIEKLITP